MTKIYFQHFGDRTVGIQGDIAVLDIDLTYDENKYEIIEDIRQLLESIWDFKTYADVREE